MWQDPFYLHRSISYIMHVILMYVILHLLQPIRVPCFATDVDRNAVPTPEASFHTFQHYVDPSYYGTFKLCVVHFQF